MLLFEHFHVFLALVQEFDHMCAAPCRQACDIFVDLDWLSSRGQSELLEDVWVLQALLGPLVLGEEVVSVVLMVVILLHEQGETDPDDADEHDFLTLI